MPQNKLLALPIIRKDTNFSIEHWGDVDRGETPKPIRYTILYDDTSHVTSSFPIPKRRFM